MNFEKIAKEQEMMVMMRKVLTTIIREITPAPGDKYPLSKQTVEDIRKCLGLIVARERELANTMGIANHEAPDELQDFQVTGSYSQRRDN